MKVPATHIPREFRQPEHVPLTEQDLEIIRQSMRISENGILRQPTDEEIYESIPGRLTGVTDTRTGEYRPNQYFQD